MAGRGVSGTLLALLALCAAASGEGHAPAARDALGVRPEERPAAGLSAEAANSLFVEIEEGTGVAKPTAIYTNGLEYEHGTKQPSLALVYDSQRETTGTPRPKTAMNFKFVDPAKWLVDKKDKSSAGEFCISGPKPSRPL